jgi:hypothetical protein
MTKPKWATNPAAWEAAQRKIRQQYGINSGPRFKELAEAQYLIDGGGLNRNALRKSDDTPDIVITPDGRLLMKAAQHFRSEAQRKFMWARHPEIAKKWAHGEHSKPDVPGKKKRGGGKPPTRGLGVHSVEAGVTAASPEGRRKLRAEKKLKLRMKKKKKDEPERKAASFEDELVMTLEKAGLSDIFPMLKAPPITPTGMKPIAQKPKTNGGMPGNGRAAKIGEVREWGRGPMRKVAENKWEPADANGKRAPKADEKKGDDAGPTYGGLSATKITNIATKVAEAVMRNMTAAFTGTQIQEAGRTVGEVGAAGKSKAAQEEAQVKAAAAKTEREAEKKRKKAEQEAKKKKKNGDDDKPPAGANGNGKAGKKEDREGGPTKEQIEEWRRRGALKEDPAGGAQRGSKRSRSKLGQLRNPAKKASKKRR